MKYKKRGAWFKRPETMLRLVWDETFHEIKTRIIWNQDKSNGHRKWLKIKQMRGA